METNNSEESVEKSNDVERKKMEPSNSTSPKFATNKDETPILSLPADILAKIIAFVPTAQWPSLDLMKNFRDATRIAWRQLRNINLDRDILIKPDRSSLDKALEYLVERSPYLTSLSGMDLQVEPNSVVISSLAKFEHLQSITMGDAQLFELVHYVTRFDRTGRVRLDALVEFLESTRSRTTLKEMQFFYVEHGYICDCGPADLHASILDRFHSSLVIAREFGCYEWTQTRRPFKLEKFSFSTTDPSLLIRLDTLDTTCLIDLSLGEPTVDGTGTVCQRNERSAARVQLTNLIERAPNLRRIEFILRCEYDDHHPRLEENKQLLAALARHENLTTIKVDFLAAIRSCQCFNFGREFIEMLNSIGRRGKLHKLVLPFWGRSIDRNEVCSTIHEYIPYLRSIKLCIGDVQPDIISNIVSMTELEEIDFSDYTPLNANAIGKISQLLHLKRLAISAATVADLNSLEHLANVTTLTDLRILYAKYISADVFEKWSEGFGSNLQVLMLDGFGFGRGMDNDRAEDGLIRLLEKAVRLRILILEGNITDRSMMAIAKSCPHLEILRVHPAAFNRQWTPNPITVHGLQGIVDHCTMLRQLGGIYDEIRSQLQIPKYRKIGNADRDFWNYDFDDRSYE